MLAIQAILCSLEAKLQHENELLYSKNIVTLVEKAYFCSMIQHLILILEKFVAL